MKKVIFISALAIAAAVSCTKSEIVDTKFNEAIGFEAYLGRDAQTKADVIERAQLKEVKVYGYYTGNTNWAADGNIVPNLWTNGLTLNLTATGVEDLASEDVRYWTNEDDLYTFLAYAPVSGITEGADKTNPTLTYTVDSKDFTNGDVLVAVPQINRTKTTWGTNTAMGGNVPLQLQHKLSRLAVRATATSAAFDFRIKEVTLSGDFYPSGTMTLSNPEAWSNTTAASTDFSFFEYDEDNETALDETKENVIGEKGYLMMIPVKPEVHKAQLKVTYTTYDNNAKQESREYTQYYDIETDFVMGKAYAITLAFENDATTINFSVTVDPWDDAEGKDGIDETEVDKTEVTPEEE